MGSSIFKVINWEETFTIKEKIAHATAVYNIVGELNGKIEVDYTIFYLDFNKEDIHASSSRFEGFMLFEGVIGEKEGSFVLYDKGSFINNQYEASVEIMTGTGTEDFVNVSGQGTYKPGNDGMILTLNLVVGE